MTANELAAIAKIPRGATITVVIICAPQMTACSMAIGKPIRTALRNVSAVGMKRPRSPLSLKSPERLKRYRIRITATTASARPVPKAAPFTPQPAPGIVTLIPRTVISLVGNIRKKLKTTSRRHISTLIILGIRMLPLQRSIPDESTYI